MLRLGMSSASSMPTYHSSKNPVNPRRVSASKTNKNSSLLDFFSKHLILFIKGSNMLNSFVKILSLCLLISITFSFPILQSQGQYRKQTGAAEITFFGKEETIWIEKREVRLPVMMGQGIKEEPWVDSFDLREHSIGPLKKMRPSTTQHGCAYSSRAPSGMKQVLVE